MRLQAVAPAPTLDYKRSLRRAMAAEHGGRTRAMATGSSGYGTVVGGQIATPRNASEAGDAFYR